jgi:hypothetical protein
MRFFEGTFTDVDNWGETLTGAFERELGEY